MCVDSHCGEYVAVGVYQIACIRKITSCDASSCDVIIYAADCCAAAVLLISVSAFSMCCVPVNCVGSLQTDDE